METLKKERISQKKKNSNPCEDGEIVKKRESLQKKISTPCAHLANFSKKKSQWRDFQKSQKKKTLDPQTGLIKYKTNSMIV